MSLIRRILIVNLSACVVSFLLAMGQSGWNRAALPGQFALSFTMPFFIATPAVLILMRYGSAMYRQRVPVNWILITATLFVCALGGTMLYNLCRIALGLEARNEFWPAVRAHAQIAVVYAMLFGIGSFVYHLLRADLDAKQLENERAGKLSAEAQLASLESHVRPHFLFNSLNTISSLIPEDPQQAEALVGKLAALLRSSLDSTQERLSSLERELKIINDYLEIEGARFGDRLRCRIDVPTELQSVEVPALALQTLIENSVKHAVASRMKGAEIRLAAIDRGDKVLVEVSDDGPGFTAADIRPGHGLDNVQRRLAALFGSSATLEISRSDGFTSVSLILPSKNRGSA